MGSQNLLQPNFQTSGYTASTSSTDCYDKSLKNMPAKEVRAWAERVLEDLRIRADLTRDRFTLLAGDRYRRYLLDHLVHFDAPLTGLRIGEQLQRLRKLCRE